MASAPTHELIGVVWRREAVEESRLPCPRCGVERAGSRTTLRRRGVLLGRPLFPLGRPAVFVTCGHCGHAFAEKALASPAAGPPPLAEDEKALMSIIAAMILSDARVQASEKEAAARVLRRYTGGLLADTEVTDLLAGARAEWGDPMLRLERLTLLVSPRTRRDIVEAAYLVCTADGDVHPQESRLLDRIGDALDLGPQEVRRAIEAARGARRAGDG